jgi:hypothetical protein
LDRLWDEVSSCFDTDDGSLPGIDVANLSPVGLSSVYAMLRRRSRPHGNPAEFWDNTQNESVLVDSVQNAAARVATGQAEAFYHCIEGVVAEGVELPVLGVFVFRDAIELSYRMGLEWGPGQVAGFFALLKECCSLDSGSAVSPSIHEGPPDPERFLSAWATYNQ